MHAAALDTRSLVRSFLRISEMTSTHVKQRSGVLARADVKPSGSVVSVRSSWIWGPIAASRSCRVVSSTALSAFPRTERVLATIVVMDS